MCNKIKVFRVLGPWPAVRKFVAAVPVSPLICEMFNGNDVIELDDGGIAILVKNHLVEPVDVSDEQLSSCYVDERDGFFCVHCKGSVDPSELVDCQCVDCASGPVERWGIGHCVAFRLTMATGVDSMIGSNI